MVGEEEDRTKCKSLKISCFSVDGSRVNEYLYVLINDCPYN